MIQQEEPERVATAAGDAPVDCVLFDLSGVLVDFQGARALGELIGQPEQEVWRRWLASPWMRRFDAGACSAEEFSTGVVREWELAMAPDEFLRAFIAWMVGPYDGAAALVAEARMRTQVGCLSNMNPIHHRQFMGWPLAAQFDRRFISCELGLVKPDPETSRYAAAELGLDPARILFLDDNVLNVEGARAVGLRAEHTRGVEQARAALVRHAVLR